MATNTKSNAVNLFLNGGRVTSGFRSSLFDQANRVGMSVNEFVITAAAEKLVQCGANFPGVFHKGDLPPTHDRARAA
ncbi:hypothetical protein VQ045_12530 [Aurantimonas sp. E1-2-R+4]|uniref:hypothetical protein n=1 Tax=Aurantimonas sp. E1-2-R+4 TaxID=3113714 RepID=UPI002F94F714